MVVVFISFVTVRIYYSFIAIRILAPGVGIIEFRRSSEIEIGVDPGLHIGTYV